MKIYRMTEKPNNISKLFISIFFYIENNISKIKKKFLVVLLKQQVTATL